MTVPLSRAVSSFNSRPIFTVQLPVNPPLPGTACSFNSWPTNAVLFAM